MENYAYNVGMPPAGVQSGGLATQVASMAYAPFAGIGSPSMLAMPQRIPNSFPAASIPRAPIPEQKPAGGYSPPRTVERGGRKFEVHDGGKGTAPVPAPAAKPQAAPTAQSDTMYVPAARYGNEGPVLSALGTADTVGNSMFMGEFAFPIVGWLLSNTIGRLPYVGTKFNNYVGAVTVAPLKAMQHTTLNNIGEFGTNYKRAWAAYATDPEMRTAGGAKFGEWKKALGDLKSLENAPQQISVGSGAFGEGMVQQFAARGARGNLTQLHGDTATMLQKLSGDKPSMWERASQMLGFKAAAKPAAETLPQFKPLADAVKQLQAEVGKEAHLVDLKAAHTHYDAANSAFKALDAKDKKAAGEVATLLEEAHGKLRSTATQLHTARSSETALQAMGTAAKNASLFNTALKGGLGLGTAYFAGKTAMGASDSIAMLKEATKDLTGREPSTLEILFSANSLPPILREARGNMIARLIPETVAGFASAGLNILFMKRHMGAKEQALMFGGMMTQMAAHNLTPAENFLNAYITAKDMQKAEQKVPQELYLELINASSVDARAAGGSGNRLVQTIAADYAAAQTPVSEMLQEIGAKEPYMKRAAKAAEQLKAADAAKHVAPAHKDEIGAKPEVNAHAADKPAKISLSDAAHQGKLGHAVQHEMGGA